MDSRNYYGEYSLEHWINLMLTGNITLPEYQRHFVWDFKDVRRLLKSLKEGQFIQPVTIAQYVSEGKRQNLILDGQQRLTSVLLLRLGCFPDKNRFLEPDSLIANEDDSVDESGTDKNAKKDLNSVNAPALWSFKDLLKMGNDIEGIRREIRKKNEYLDINEEINEYLTEGFFEKKYIGFSYIVPNDGGEAEIRQTFSKLFRSINYFGRKLDALESRKSLYFQNSELTKYFEGTSRDKDVLCGIGIIENFSPHKIDFVRYLSILSQYHANRQDENKVLVGYSAYSSRESYYADYVSYILKQGLDEQEGRSDKFDSFKFDEVFKNSAWQNRYCTLEKSVRRLREDMNLNEKYPAYNTWLEADYWLFGLIYFIVFEGRCLKDDLSRCESGNKSSLKEEIQARVNQHKNESDYLKNTNRLVNIRQRLKESCEIYKNYVTDISS